MAEIHFHDVQKIYPDGTRAIRDFELEVPDGELLVLVGPSGCGKSTALRMLAGLEDISSGEIHIGERRVDRLPPQERNIAMVFQNYALYPHMTVRQNLEFPLKMMKVGREETARRVDAAARTLSIEALLDRRPKNLSGGQRQRVAMGRALVREPEAFLMDEPLSNLDAKLRVQMRAEIASLQRRLGTTTLYVTHDQVEALTLGDRIAVLKAGVLQQVGTPQEIFDRPASTFVAAFIGSPSMNLLQGRIVAGADGGLAVRLGAPSQDAAGGLSLALAEGALERHPSLAEKKGEELILGLRPEAFVPAEKVPESQRLSARLEAVEALGHEVIAYLQLDVAAAAVDDARDLAPAVSREGTEPEATEGASATLLAARLPPAFDLEPGDEVTVGVDTGQAYLFALDGRAL